MINLSRRVFRLTSQAIVRYGAKGAAIPFFAGVSTADYLFPVLPNEGMAVALGILQPARTRIIALAFASASALGALILGGLILTVSDVGQQIGLDVFGEEWSRVMRYVETYGPITMFFAAMFPSPPRTMIAATVFSGVPMIVVAGAVLAGKLVLFVIIFQTIDRVPAWLAQRKSLVWPWPQAKRVAVRFLVFRRWLLSKQKS